MLFGELELKENRNVIGFPMFYFLFFIFNYFVSLNLIAFHDRIDKEQRRTES